MDSRVHDAFVRLPDYLGNHVLVSMTALLLGTLVSLPLAFACWERPTARAILLAAAGVVQTIPGLALLALFYPLLLGAAQISMRLLGFGFSAFGFLPAVLALALYSMLPILRNVITGLMTIDTSVREAALGVGMTRRQSLIMVDIPLAMPMIMAGIRTSAVWVIGTATLSTPIGQTSLGNYIFTGLQTQNWIFVLFGCAAAAILALGVDQLLGLIERGITPRRRSSLSVGVAGFALVAMLGLIPNAQRSEAKLLIGSKPFAEQYILAALIEQRLHANGILADRRDGLGSAVIFAALTAGDIEAYVDYSGTIWSNQMHRDDIRPREEVLQMVSKWVSERHQIRMLGGLGFENAYALAVPDRLAQELKLNSISDLARHSAALSIAGDYEFFGRPEWKALVKAYGLVFREQRQMQAEFMYPAAAAREVDVISAYTSDGRIAQYSLKVLDDPLHALPPYDAILLVSSKRANDPTLLNALTPLIGAISVETMREANLRSSNGESPENTASWLAARIGQ
jgi:osmoprotectant transport system permease protein